MKNSEAMTWLQDMKGRLYRTKKRSEKPEAWVAIVRVPGNGARVGKMIIALGESAGGGCFGSRRNVADTLERPQ
jgi:hypothetical protein